jgi:predicted nucleic acid-binding protein
MAAAEPAFVVDASVSAAWFLPDEATARTEAALHATATQDVWVPALWLLEVGNLLLRAHRRKRITADKRRDLALAATALRLKVDREAVTISVLDRIAEAYALSAYDAAYLELALRRGLPMATQDDALRAAMAKAGVPAAELAP